MQKIAVVFTVLLLHLHFYSAAQPLDSINAYLDSTARVIQQTKKDFQQWQDSVQRTRILRQVEQNGQPLHAFLEDQHEREQKEKRQTYIRFGLGALFLVLLIISIVRRSRRRSR